MLQAAFKRSSVHSESHQTPRQSLEWDKVKPEDKTLVHQVRFIDQDIFCYCFRSHLHCTVRAKDMLQPLPSSSVECSALHAVINGALSEQETHIIHSCCHQLGAKLARLDMHDACNCPTVCATCILTNCLIKLMQYSSSHPRDS